MRTRTLLLMSVACGLAILLAGGLQLLRISGSEPSGVLGVGERGQAGGAVVVVTAFDEQPDLAVVSVVLSGVDDPDGLLGFALRAPNAVVAPTDRSTCTGFTVEACYGDFSGTAFDVGSADEQVWVARKGRPS